MMDYMQLLSGPKRFGLDPMLGGGGYQLGAYDPRAAVQPLLGAGPIDATVPHQPPMPKPRPRPLLADDGMMSNLGFTGEQFRRAWQGPMLGGMMPGDIHGGNGGGRSVGGGGRGPVGGGRSQAGDIGGQRGHGGRRAF